MTRARVRVTATAEEVFDGADILVEASRLTVPEPLLRTAAVKPGAFVVPYGTISAVELDLLDVMDKVVVDDWREAQSGRFGALRRHVDTGRPRRRRSTPSWARSSPGGGPAGNATTSGSCSGTAGWPSSISPWAWPSCAGPSSGTPGTMLRYR